MSKEYSSTGARAVSRRRWTTQENEILMRTYHEGLKPEAVAPVLGRTKSAIYKQLSKLRGRGLLSSPVEAEGIFSGESVTKKLFVYGDLHIPYQDDQAVDIMFELLAIYQPDIVVVNGDLLDCDEISVFAKVDPEHPSLTEELGAGEDHLRRLRKIVSKARIIFIEGNHERRLPTYISVRAPALLPVSTLRIDSLLNLAELDIEFVPSKTKGICIDLGKILVGHWHRYSKHSAYTAKMLVEELGKSLIQGHTHRLGAYYKTNADHEIVGFEGGCLCTLDPRWIQFPNWQQGFCTITMIDQCFQVQQIPIVRSEEGLFAIFGDRIFWRQYKDSQHHTI